MHRSIATMHRSQTARHSAKAAVLHLPAAGLTCCLLMLFLLLGLAAGSVQAANAPEGRGAAANASEGRGAPAAQRGNRADDSLSIGIGITVDRARELAMAHNHTGYSGLPPGIQRNLARGKPLPPGLARRYVPRDMLAELPVVRDHEWRVAGDDLILVTLGTMVVTEILNDVFR